MALHRSPHRDDFDASDFDAEARSPSLVSILTLALMASGLGLAIVTMLGALLFGR